jgi:NAD(P)-dependent dehydrogenase (short-subunit alcohol dehydrogenase family)
MRVVVVGASSGLGRCIAVGLGARGSHVALLARREERLQDVAAEIGEGAHAVVCDVTDEVSSRAAIEQAADALGGIDALVYATGVGTLRRIHEVDAATWRHTLDTNVVGASLVTAAALPHLLASRGRAAYLTSVSASGTPPWPGLGAYAVSKAALEKLVDAWRAEHPHVGFTRVVVGECAGGEGDAMTEFTATWDAELATEVAPLWISRNYMDPSTLMEVSELVRSLDHVLHCDASANIPTLAVVPRPAP